MALALALCLLGGAIFYVDLAGRRGQALPHWAPAEAAAWLRTNGSLAAAGGALAVGILGVLVAAGARRRPSAAAAAGSGGGGDGEVVERLRRQVEPLASGDLAVWLPEAEGALGEIHRTLNLLIGGVSDLVAAADDASVQLLGAVQDGRGGLAGLKVEADRGRQLADDVLDRARHALSAARALGGRTKAKEPAAKGAHAGPPARPLPEAEAQGALADRLEGIADVIRDLAEQAHVLAVGVSVQAAAADAPAALRGVADDAGVLADQAARAVGRIGPLVQAAMEESRAAAAAELRPTAGSERAHGGSAAGRRVADQVAALAEVAASLRAGADRVARAQDEASAALGALAELAHRLRRATGRFRLPG
jgi:hypothetical protein